MIEMGALCENIIALSATSMLEGKTEKIEQKTAEPKRENTKSERKTKKQDSNIIQLDLFA